MGWPQRRTSRLSMEDPYWIGLDSPERRQRQRVPVDYKLMPTQAQTGGFFLFCPCHKEAFPSFYFFSLVYLFIF